MPSPPNPLSLPWERGRRRESSLDDAEYAGQIGDDPIGGHAQHTIAGALKLCLTLKVVLVLGFVYPAVDLHNETNGGAEEVDNVRPDRLLAPEPISAEMTAAQVLPQHRLRRSCPPSKLAPRRLRPRLTRARHR